MDSAVTALKGVLVFVLGFLGKLVVSCRRTFSPRLISYAMSGDQLGGTRHYCFDMVPAGRVQPLKMFCDLCSGTKSDKAVGISSTDIFL